MRTPVREAFSYGIRHVHCDSMSYDQIRGIIPRIPWCSKIWRMILGRIVNHFKKSDWSYGNERKTSPTNHTQFTWLKLWIKEENGVHKIAINLTSHHTGRVTIHFVYEVVAYEKEDAYCQTGKDTAYDTWWLWGMSEWFVPRLAVWITHLYGMMPVVQNWIK